ncbi:MAG: hypothetical protein VW270_21215 [Candidatus Poseidoniales archaeon]
MITLINSFSPNMLGQNRMTMEWTPVSLREVQVILEQESHQSYMGQYNVANIFGRMTGQEIKVNRKPYYVHPNDVIIQVQYIGPYFDDDADQLPEGGRIIYWKIVPLNLRSSFQADGNHYMVHSTKGVSYV